MKHLVEIFDRYYVSDQGDIYSMKSGELKKLRPRINNYGYGRLLLDDGGRKYKEYLVHRLVAEAFCPKLVGKEVVNHINGIKTDNRAANLEWCTPKENVEHAIRTGLARGYKKYHGIPCNYRNCEHGAEIKDYCKKHYQLNYRLLHAK